MSDKSNESMYKAAGCGVSPQPAAKKRYVQHVSGQGKKWEVREGAVTDRSPFWCVDDVSGACLTLPKCEYQLFEPVKVWRDVTAECEIQFGNIMHVQECGGFIPLLYSNGSLVDGYRMRKVHESGITRCSPHGVGTAYFIIEREEEA